MSHLTTLARAVAYKEFSNDEYYSLISRTALLLFGFMMLSVAFNAVIKHRHFRGVWIEKANDIEHELGLGKIPMDTGSTKNTRTYEQTSSQVRMFLSSSAELSLSLTIGLIVLVFAILTIHSFYRFMLKAAVYPWNTVVFLAILAIAAYLYDLYSRPHGILSILMEIHKWCKCKRHQETSVTEQV